MNTITNLANAMSVITLLWGVCFAQDTVMSKDVSPLGSGCFSTHAFGSGGKYIKVCFSNHGNIGHFESPSGNRYLVGRDGYVVCAQDSTTGYVAHDAGGQNESNWGNPVISQPNGPNKFPLTITRKTLNNWLELKQNFEMDAAEYDVTITMTLKNISNKTLSGVTLDRYADWDVTPNNADDYFQTGQTGTVAWTAANNQTPLVSLSSASTETPVNLYQTFNEWVSTVQQCRSGTRSPLPAGPGDFVSRISRGFGTMSPGTSKTIKFVYRRF